MIKKLRLHELKRLLWLAGKEKRSFILALLAYSASYPIFSIIFGLLIKLLFNAIEFSNKQMLVGAFILGLAAIVLQAVLEPLVGYYYLRKAVMYLTNLKLDLYTHIQKMPISYIQNTHSGDLMSRINNDINVIYDSYNRMRALSETLIFGVGSTILMLIIDWRLTVALGVLGFVYVWVYSLYVKPVQVLSDGIQQRMGTVTEYFSDLLSGIRVVKIFNPASVVRNFVSANDQLANDLISRSNKNAQLDMANFLFSILNVVGVLVIGSFMISTGKSNLGAIMAIITLQTGFSELFLHVGTGFVELQESLAGAARVFELLNLPVEPERIDLEQGNCEPSDTITIQNLVFGYDEQKKILDQVSISVKKGEIAALVGHSGSGKTTLLKTLMGFNLPEQGSICIEGQPINGYTLAQLRKKIAYVSQDVFLFDTTIEENIRYGNPSATKEQIIEAAKYANAHNFITEFGDGYATKVGERGVNLSGGQRQRIAIARAILKNAPILLLDEATSALDTDNELLVQEALNSLMQDRTTIVIAHRLSTIKNADVIYVMSEGKIVEQGQHKELLDMDSLYFELYQAQFEASA